MRQQDIHPPLSKTFQPAAIRHRLRQALACTGVLLCLLPMGHGAIAAPFAKGNLVVYRVGPSGAVTTLAATGNAVFLDEYTTAGSLVQTIAMPTAASGAQLALAASGTAAVDGLLTRSANGNCLVVPGYGRDLGTGSGNLTTTGTTLINGVAGAIPRVVAKVDAIGAVDTTTALTDFALGSNFRSAATTDCNTFWMSGSASAANTSAGVHSATVGATTSTDLSTVGGFTAGRQVTIAGGQLYVSSASTTANRRGIFSIGTGTPTAAVTPVRLAGLTDSNSASSYGFVFADLDNSVAGVDTLYIADDTSTMGTGATTTGGGIHKFSLVGGVWTWNGTVGSAADAYRGLTAVVNGTSVTLYATRKGGSTSAGGGELVSVTDASGYNGAFAGSPAVLATAASGNAFRGVALAPEVTVTSSAGANGTISQSTPQTISGGATVSFTLTPNAGYVALVAGSCGGSLVGNTYTTLAVTTNCSVDVTFTQQTTFAVTPGATSGGTINPSTPVTVTSGSSTAFTVTPSTGFTASVGGTCGGSLAGTTYTTNAVLAACTVNATFTRITYTVTPSAGPNGSISPATAQTVNAASSQIFTIAPNAGYAATVGGSCGGTLVGTTYTTNGTTANCTVSATFTALPSFTVTLVAVGSGTVSPSIPQTVLQNGTIAFTPTPASGHSVVMSGCGGKMSGGVFTIAAASANCTVTASFSQKNILFVGNSYTFARVAPAMTFNATNVTDLTTAFNAQFPNGTNSWPWNGSTCTGASSSDGCFEPHPWGGVPGIFKALTVQAGLDYNISFSTRNAATLRGHFLNTSNNVWDLRSNIASQKWDVVMVQGQSDEPLPANKSKNGNPEQFKTYANQIAKYVHQGNGLGTDLVTTEQAIYAAEGFGTSSSTTPRTIPANPNANANAKVYVMQNWSRPDMVEAHKCNVPDYTSNDGAPLVDPTCSAGANGSTGTGLNNVFYTAKGTTALNLNDITTDMNSAMASLVTGNSQFAGIIPVGNAFQKAVNDGRVKTSGFYNASGTYDESGIMNLWWLDRTHGSKYGSYLSALVHFARISGQDPTQFGAADNVAAGLGIAGADAVTLQQVAKATVVPGVPTAVSATAGNGQVTVGFAAPSNLGGLDVVGYTANCGGQAATASASPITVSGLTNGVPVTCAVAAANSVGMGTYSSPSASVFPVGPVTPPAPVLNVIPQLFVPTAGMTSAPIIANMNSGAGPLFTTGMVSTLSNALGAALQFVGQSISGSVVLSGFNGRNLAFIPHSYQSSDARANGIYAMGNGQYQVVNNGQSIVIAPALVNLDQLMALLPGISASQSDNGVITAALNGITYVVQPDAVVQRQVATGNASLELASDGYYHFVDSAGNNQILYPAFGEPSALRTILRGLDGASSMGIQLDGTAAIVLNGQNFTLVPNLMLDAIPADWGGRTWRHEAAAQYRFVNPETQPAPKMSQVLTVKQ